MITISQFNEALKRTGWKFKHTKLYHDETRVRYQMCNPNKWIQPAYQKWRDNNELLESYLHCEIEFQSGISMTKERFYVCLYHYLIKERIENFQQEPADKLTITRKEPIIIMKSKEI